MYELCFDVGKDMLLLVDLGKMECGGFNVVFFVIWVLQYKLDVVGYVKVVQQVEEKYDVIGDMLMVYLDCIWLVIMFEQVMVDYKVGLLLVMIGVENVYLFGYDLYWFDVVYDCGVCYVGLVYVGNNDLCISLLFDIEYGESVMNSFGDYGMSDFGCMVVKWVNVFGIMVDILYVFDCCVCDVFVVFIVLIIVLYFGVCVVFDYLCNFFDDLLCVIVVKGGVIQVVVYKEFLMKDLGCEVVEKKLQVQVVCEVGDKEYDLDKYDYLLVMVKGMVEIEKKFLLFMVDDYVKQICYMVDVVGIDYVGIVLDFDGGGGIIGWVDVSQICNVIVVLWCVGFSDGDIVRIWGGNFLWVWSEVECDVGW